MKFEPYKISGIDSLSENVRALSLSPKSGGLPAYLPGQFFLLRLPDASGKQIFRSYSIASSPGEPHLVFCIKRKGAFTALLWQLKDGDGIDADGPYGNFTLTPSDTTRAFIGAGVGASPFRSMVLQSIKDGITVSFFQSSREFSGLLFFKELNALAASNPSFKFIPTITCENKPAEWKGMCGRISAQTVAQHCGDLSNISFYICGSKEMVAQLAEGLIAKGAKKEKIKSEGWG